MNQFQQIFTAVGYDLENDNRAAELCDCLYSIYRLERRNVPEKEGDIYFGGHRFPAQGEPGLDLVMVELTEVFGSRCLEVHDSIVKIMDSKNIPLTNKDVRWMLSKMAIQTKKILSQIELPNPERSVATEAK